VESLWGMELKLTGQKRRYLLFSERMLLQNVLILISSVFCAKPLEKHMFSQVIFTKNSKENFQLFSLSKTKIIRKILHQHSKVPASTTHVKLIANCSK
jgi:hypothetical protein